MKKIFAFLFSLVLASCSQQPQTSVPTIAAVEIAPVEVHTKAAEERAMPRYLRVTGELKGEQQAMVAADASGKVVEVPVERGAKVNAGDVLLKLDDRAALLSLKEAEASLAEAQLKLDWQNSEFARNEPLAKTKAISDTNFQRFKIDRASAEAGLLAAKARRDMAEKTLKDVTIKAPFTGTVSERLVSLGEYVSTNSQVASLVATDKLRLVLNVQETSVGKIKEGQAVGFNVPAYPGKNFTAIVKYIGASVRGEARDLIIEAIVSNTDELLKPGMFAEGRISLENEKSVTIPSNALRVEGSNRRVFVIENDHMVERLVEVGEASGDFVEIRRGIQNGENVIITPNLEAADGMKVKLSAQL